MNQSVEVVIESVDFEGKGVARIEGKTVFVDGALTGERLLVEIVRRKPSFDKAKILEIIEPSVERIKPDCPNYGICGGCSMQHISFDAQVLIKQQVLLDNLTHIGKVTPQEVIEPLAGIPWGYRNRARLSVRHVLKKGGALVGFREKAGAFVADMHECKVLPVHVSNLITPLRELISLLSLKDRIPQIELAVGKDVTILVLRNMDTFSLDDEVLIKHFIDNHTTADNILQVWFQPKGPDTCYPFYPLDAPKLSYAIKCYAIEMPYYPAEFTQVNPYINEQMIDLAIKLLAPKDNELIADFFCGIGNFTLPIAKFVKQVVGIEGADNLVKRALQNAEYNNLVDKVSYQVCNLFKVDANWLDQLGKFDKWLIDPPRDGAFELIKSITPQIAPRIIVYVSCNPATLARDAHELVHTHGYKLLKAGIMNMFPHTSHVESIALFELA